MEAAALSDALHAGGSQDPHVAYTLRGVPSEGIQSVSLRIDGQTLTSAGNAPPKQFVWQGAGAHQVNGTVKFGGPDLGWADYEGLWSLFQFFGDAERWQPAGSGYDLEWIVRTGKKPVTLAGKPLTVRFYLDMAGAPPVFQKGYFSRLACVAEVVR